MSTPTFQEQIHDLWRTRPVRLPNQGHVAGVCAGIGYRYGVDPILVRVAFVVSTIFGGSGILLYVAGWLLLPRTDIRQTQTEPARRQQSDNHTKYIVLLAALAIAATTIGPLGAGQGGSGLIGLMLMLGGWWLLHQRQPIPPALPPNSAAHIGSGTVYPGTGFTPGAFTPGAFTPNQPPVYTPYTKLPDSYVPDAAKNAENATESPATVDLSKNEAAIAPPAWDPLGVAPFAWDLPDPITKSPPLLPLPPRRRRSRWTLTVLGLAIIAASVTGAVGAATGNDWFTPGRIGGVGLAVIGFGLVLGAFFRKGYGLLVVAAPLAGGVFITSLIHPVEFDVYGEQLWTPTSVSEIQPSYSGGFGSFTLDLRDLTFTEDKTIDVSAAFGEFKVLLPQSVNVQNDCTVVMGDGSRCLDGGIHSGTQAGPDSPVITVNAKATFGALEVSQP